MYTFFVTNFVKIVVIWKYVVLPYTVVKMLFLKSMKCIYSCTFGFIVVTLSSYTLCLHNVLELVTIL